MRAGQKRDRARELRAAMTDAERTLWRCLRLRQLDGYRFRRQVPIGPYVADFACLQAGLVVEVDGGQHAGTRFDQGRDAFLRAQGFSVLRFWNNEVLRNPDAVCGAILAALGDAPLPASPRKRGEEWKAEGRKTEARKVKAKSRGKVEAGKG
jgi:very-short-patch-repair endonuclease